MYVLLILLQAIGVVILTLVGVVPDTKEPDPRKPGKDRLSRKGHILLIFGSITFVLASVLLAIETKRTERGLHRQISELKGLQWTARQVLEGEVPICKVKSPLPLPEKVERLEIRLPADGSHVSGQFYVEGIVPDPESDVFVIFHSIASPNFHVQPKVTVCDDNIWRVKIYMEKTVSISVASVFEILAVANPRIELKEGDVLAGWPEAQWTSEVIEVIRK